MLRDDLLERLERLDEDAYLLYPGEERIASSSWAGAL